MAYDIYAFGYSVLTLVGWVLWLSILFWFFGVPDAKKNQQQIKKIALSES